MEPTSPSPKSKVSWLAVASLAIVVVLAVLIGGYYFLVMKNQRSNEDFSRQLDAIHDVHHTGDHSEAIRLEENALSTVSNKADEAHIRAMLAFDYALRNGPGDMDKAMQMYKDIISDESLPASSRALVLDDLTTLLMGGANRAFIERYFSGQPYYLSTQGDDPYAVQRAAIQMFKYSDQLYPNSFAKLSIVNAYTLLVSANALGKNEDKEMVASMMQDYIRQAQTLMKKDLYEPSNEARQYLYAALGLGLSNRILNNVSFEDREAAYKRILSFEDQVASDYQLRAVVLQGRFFYAGFLLDYKRDERLSDIQSILQPFADAVQNPSQYSVIKQFFLGVLARPDDDMIKKRIPLLSEISPEFKSYISSIQAAQ